MGCFGDAISLLLTAITRLRRKLDRNSSSYLTSLTTSRRPLVLFVCFVFFWFVCFHSLYNIIRTLWPICFSKVDSAHVIFYYSQFIYLLSADLMSLMTIHVMHQWTNRDVFWDQECYLKAFLPRAPPEMGPLT